MLSPESELFISVLVTKLSTLHMLDARSVDPDVTRALKARSSNNGACLFCNLAKADVIES